METTIMRELVNEIEDTHVLLSKLIKCASSMQKIKTIKCNDIKDYIYDSLKEFNLSNGIKIHCNYQCDSLVIVIKEETSKVFRTKYTVKKDKILTEFNYALEQDEKEFYLELIEMLLPGMPIVLSIKPLQSEVPVVIPAKPA